MAPWSLVSLSIILKFAAAARLNRMAHARRVDSQEVTKLSSAAAQEEDNPWRQNGQSASNLGGNSWQRQTSGPSSAMANAPSSGWRQSGPGSPMPNTGLRQQQKQSHFLPFEIRWRDKDPNKDESCSCRCKQPEGILLDPAGGDNRYCHWDRSHNYFWCKVNKAQCPCLTWRNSKRSWVKCGANTVHYTSIVREVSQKIERGSDPEPCMWKFKADRQGWTNGTRNISMFGVIRNHKSRDFMEKYNEAIQSMEYRTSPDYRKALDDMADLKQLCEMPQVQSNTKNYGSLNEAYRSDRSMNYMVKDFLSRFPSSRSGRGPREFGMEVCYRAMSRAWNQRTWQWTDRADPCSSDTSQNRPTCRSRRSQVADAYAKAQANKASSRAYQSMQYSLPQDSKLELGRIQASTVPYAQSCLLGMQKAKQWQALLRR
jgi:hypothetical protein